MLTQCKACAAVNVLDVERAATGKARCMICRKRLALPDDDGPQSRSSFPASANLEAATVDPSRGISEEMETELTPLLALNKVKELMDGTVPGASLVWNDVTRPDPLRIEVDMSGVPDGFDVEMTGQINTHDIIDTRDADAEKMLILDSSEMEDVDELELVDERDFKEATAPFELSRPSESSRISENLPMVFDAKDPNLVSTVPSIPAAKRHKLSLLAASVLVFALGATDLLATHKMDERRAAAASGQANATNVDLVQPASAPPTPPPQEIAAALEKNTVPVENLPVTVVAQQAAPSHHRHASPKATDGESLTRAADLAFKNNDLTTARMSYELAIASNPHYFPARIGAADVAWAAGDRMKAREAYKSLKENFPSDMLPARVFEREVASR